MTRIRLVFVLVTSSVGLSALCAGCSGGDDDAFGEASSSSTGGSSSLSTSSSSGAVGGGAAAGGEGSVGGGAGTGGEPGAGGSGGEPQTCASMCDDIDQKCNMTDACGQLGNDCSGNLWTHCDFQCLISAPCDDVKGLISGGDAPTLEACLGGCGSGHFCRGCMKKKCGDAMTACTNDPVCAAWLTCAQGCDAPDCFAGCDAQYPAASALYGDVYDCTCASCELLCPTFAQTCG